MKNGKTVVLLIVILFFLGIVIGGSISSKTFNDKTDDFENEITNPGNNVEDNIVVTDTSNIFVIVGRGLDKIINKGITFVVDLLSKVFGFIFGI